MDTQEWLLKRNCSLTPRQLGRAYAVLALLSFTVAASFMLLGAWQILLFTVLEMSAVALAFLVYARHATDHEHIVLSADCLLVEQVKASEVRLVRLDPAFTRVGIPRSPQDLISLEEHAVRIEVGGLVTAARRLQVARELRARLPSAAGWPKAA
jgi:uncharacterized membrane protein